MGRLPPQVQRTVEAQLGVVARSQLCAELGPTAADDLLRSGWFERVERGVYRIVGGARLPLQRAVAATLRCGPDATLSGPAALRLMELGELPLDAPFVVLLAPGRRIGRVSFPWKLDADPARPVARRGELRVAGPLDALLDAAGFLDDLGERQLRLSHDTLRWSGVLRPGRLSERARNLGLDPGRDRGLATLLDWDGDEATGEGERELGRILRRFVPAPEPQVWVTPHRRVDWFFRPVRYAFEYQGAVDHETVAGRLADAERDEELRGEGVRISYVTDADLRDERSLIGTVAAALTVRAHELGVEPPVLRTQPADAADEVPAQAGRSSR